MIVGSGAGDDPAARRRAVVVAGHQGDAGTAGAAVADPDPTVRAAALGALFRLGQLDDDRLAAATADPDVGVRRRAVELAGRGPAGAGPAEPAPEVSDQRRRALVAALADDDRVAEAAAFALGELEDDHPDVVAALATMAAGHGDALCREAAVAALGAIGQGLDVILAALAGDRATVRRRAVIALAPFDGPEVDAALRRALDDRDWQVRQAAEDLLDD